MAQSHSHQPPGSGSPHGGAGPEGPAPDHARLRHGHAVAHRRAVEAHVGAVLGGVAHPVQLSRVVAGLELGGPASAEDELSFRSWLVERPIHADRLVVERHVAVLPRHDAVRVAGAVQVLVVVRRSRQRLDHDRVDVVDVELQGVHDGRSRLAARPPCDRELARDDRGEHQSAELVVGVAADAVRQISLAGPLTVGEVGPDIDRVDGAGVHDGDTVAHLGEVRAGRGVRRRHEAGGHDARQRDAEYGHELVMHCRPPGRCGGGTEMNSRG